MLCESYNCSGNFKNFNVVASILFTEFWPIVTLERLGAFPRWSVGTMLLPY